MTRDGTIGYHQDQVGVFWYQQCELHHQKTKTYEQWRNKCLIIP